MTWIAPFAVAAVAAWLGPRTPLGSTGTAIILGLVWAALGRRETASVARIALWIGIALLAVRIPWSAVEPGPTLALGGTAILAALASAWLAVRAGMAPGLAWALGVGTGICGASAIAATRNVTGTNHDEASHAAAAVTLLGTLGILAWPLVARLPLDAAAWAGASLQAVPHALAAGAIAGDAPGAGVVKMGRVALLPFVALGLAIIRSRGGRFPVPSELLAFAFVAAISSFLSPSAINVLGDASESSLLIGFAALAMATRWQRQLARVLAAAAAMWSVVLAATGLVVLWLL